MIADIWLGVLLNILFTKEKIIPIRLSWFFTFNTPHCLGIMNKLWVWACVYVCMCAILCQQKILNFVLTQFVYVLLKKIKIPIVWLFSFDWRTTLHMRYCVNSDAYVPYTWQWANIANFRATLTHISTIQFISTSHMLHSLPLTRSLSLSCVSLLCKSRLHIYK